MRVPFFDLQRQYKLLQAELDKAVLDVLSSCSFIGGAAVKRFEEEAAAFLGAPYTISCASGTSALMLALRACGIHSGDEVITTAFSFFATAEAIAAVGATPVFCDISPEGFNIDPLQIEAKITNKTKAILPVHLFGEACEMDQIMEIARRHGLTVIEDAAQAFGCEYHGEKIGTTADLSCFSFYPTKNLGGIGDGGMVTTGKKELSTVLRALKEHGAGRTGAEARGILDGNPSALEELSQTTSSYDPYKYVNALIGDNSRLDAIQAAALSVKLRHLEHFNQARAAIARIYTSLLCDEMQKPAVPQDGSHCWHQYVIRTKRKDELCAFLNEHGIGAGTFYPIPLHLQKAFDDLKYRSGDCPRAEQAATETVCLPIFPELTESELAYVADTVNQFFHK